MTVGVVEKRRRRSQAPPPAEPQTTSRRGWLWAVCQLTALGTLVFLILFLPAQPALRPTDIRVIGTRHQSVAEVVSALAIDSNRSIFFLNHGELEQRLTSLPWIQSADVRVSLPDRVDVQVREWKPIAVLQVAELSYYLNERGTVLGTADEAGHLLVLDRTDAVSVKKGDTAVSGDLLQMLVPLQAGFYPAFKVKVASFELDARQVLTLRTQRGWTITFGQMITDADRATLEPKLAALRALSTRLDLTSAPIDYINLMNYRAPAVQLRRS